MRRIGILLPFCASVAFAQTHTVPGHWTKSGKWVAAHEVKDKERSESPSKINRDLVKGFQNKPLRKPSQPKDPYAEAQSHLGKHKEYRYFPGHTTKSGHFIPSAWRWVWVKD